MDKEKFLLGFEEYKKIREYLQKNFEYFLDSACEEFIDYYGEKYKDIITYRLHNANYIFYVNEEEKLVDSLDKVFDRGNFNERYKIIKKQHKQVTDYLKGVKKHVDKFNSENENFEIVKIVNRKVYDTSLDTYSDTDKAIREQEINHLIFKYGSSCAFFTPIYLEDSKKIEHDIVIPLFKADDGTLIHEMIHAIMSQDLLLINENEPYLKTGISITVNRDAEEKLEEWITEIESKRITKRMKEKGIELINCFFPKKVSTSSYDTFIPFVIDFYDYFKDILTYSRITLNKSHLLEQIDRNNYYDFMVAIVNCYKNYFEDYDFCYHKKVFEEETKKMKDSYKVLKLK